MFDEIHSRHGRDGREARTALPVSPRLKAVTAASGALACLTLAAVLWATGWGPGWLAVVVLVIGVWAVADTGLQWHRYRVRNRDNPTRKGTQT
ncbi:hypothetical protein [Stackebrandtia nassauensis]|uniref:Uncharacterized protein n=1 Tax=Stackebrandtia nassauensis (strain DSM 44728 / CIP 108903 / NRRL B-16338 / NBRC 102104 / LLR-40K-21) TaxID=446470 RepID=D3Q897_STANL|nr:hypothetical protein [Stackebrandtia nassauensis]ADD42471.1 hypothetical protein Snas_2795 [Stackebrandtia nassauensis DSM 44728]